MIGSYGCTVFFRSGISAERPSAQDMDIKLLAVKIKKIRVGAIHERLETSRYVFMGNFTGEDNSGSDYLG